MNTFLSRLRDGVYGSSRTNGSRPINDDVRALAEKLYDVIIPKRGVPHEILSMEDIPKKGLPCISTIANGQISTREYVSLVAPIIEYVSDATRAAFVKELVNTKDKTIRADAILAVGSYHKAFTRNEWIKLARYLLSGASISSTREEYGLRSIESEIHTNTSLTEYVSRLEREHDALKNYELTYRVWDPSSSDLIRDQGRIAIRLRDAVELHVRAQNPQFSGDLTNIATTSAATTEPLDTPADPQSRRDASRPNTPPAPPPYNAIVSVYGSNNVSDGHEVSGQSSLVDTTPTPRYPALNRPLKREALHVPRLPPIGSPQPDPSRSDTPPPPPYEDATPSMSDGNSLPDGHEISQQSSLVVTRSTVWPSGTMSSAASDDAQGLTARSELFSNDRPRRARG